jgi:hypothetical protein
VPNDYTYAIQNANRMNSLILRHSCFIWFVS